MYRRNINIKYAKRYREKQKQEIQEKRENKRNLAK